MMHRGIGNVCVDAQIGIDSRAKLHPKTIEPMVAIIGHQHVHINSNMVSRCIIIAGEVLFITTFGKEVYTRADMPVQTAHQREVLEEAFESGSAVDIIDIDGPFVEREFVAQGDEVDELAALILEKVEYKSVAAAAGEASLGGVCVSGIIAYRSL